MRNGVNYVTNNFFLFPSDENLKMHDTFNYRIHYERVLSF
jgi:hypothetical protein